MKRPLFPKFALISLIFALLPLSASCSPVESRDRTPVLHNILHVGDASGASHQYLEFYPITSSDYVEPSSSESSGSAEATSESSGSAEATSEDSSDSGSSSAANPYTGKFAVGLKKDATVPSQIVIPDTWSDGSTDIDVIGIVADGFRETTATSIQLPKNLKVIDYEAFLGSSLQSITIPYTIMKMGDSAFYGCHSLASVRFRDSNKESSSATECPCEESQNGCGVSGGGSGESGGSAEEEAIYCQLEEIPAFCFFNCKAMTSLILPSSIRTIEYEAFDDCHSLSSTICFKKIETIRERAFQGCSALRNVYISETMFNGNGGNIEPLAFNRCSSELNIYFCTTETKKNNWLANHSEWGWYNETGATKFYLTATIPSDISFGVAEEWTYSIDEYGAKIVEYTGNGVPNGFLIVPDVLGGAEVRRIGLTAFNSVKGSLTHLYLPTTLYAIESNMFASGYSKLYVVDSNDNVSRDWSSQYNEGTGKWSCVSSTGDDGRIDLSHLVNLQFIGDRAFAQMAKRSKIKKLHLPANLVAIGNEAFCAFEVAHLDAVNDFQWDFNINTSRLEVIGTDAFYKLGVPGDNQVYNNDTYSKNIKPATLIFPKTFKYFGMTDTDVTRYKNPASAGTGYIPFTFTKAGKKAARPAHCFINCPLIGNIIFKGSTQEVLADATITTDSSTNDLIIPNQTFNYNENLQYLIFEERKGHYITFHTQQGKYAQQAVGANAGAGKNDFRGRPFLQTLVLPNVHTYLRFQNLALTANSRAVMYLSGTYGTNMYYDNKTDTWPSFSFEEKPLENAALWRTIGDESYYNAVSESDKGYLGYCFDTGADASTAKTKTPDTSKKLNKFYLNQKMPYYENVHYKDTNISYSYYGYDSTTGKYGTLKGETSVEVGSSGEGHLEYKEKDKCAFLLGGTETIGGVAKPKAIMTKYLYRLWPDGNDEDKDHNFDLSTVTIPDIVNHNSTDYYVTEIGASAFSAAFCSGALNGNQGATNDFKNVNIPDNVTKIGDYAFMRAYGLDHVNSYTRNGNAITVKADQAPSKLQKIGRNAFSFCGIQLYDNIPDDCLFFENYTKDARDTTEYPNYNDSEVTSVFTNCFNLRRVSFKHGNASMSAESNCYVTSTYLAGDPDTSEITYTTAIYSKATAKNANRLLLILNRPYLNYTVGGVSKSTYDNPSKDDSPIKDFVTSGTETIPTFKVPDISGASYDDNPFLYGAYKMAYWIKNVSIGYCTTTTGSQATNRDQILPQPLFSGIANRESGKEVTKNIIYLKIPAKNYAGTGDNNTVSDLVSAEGAIFYMPEYAFNGCETLQEITLPDNPGATLPNGLFANADNANLKYSTSSDDSTAHLLDLTDTGYAAIGEETFLNNESIYTVKPPAVSNFTFGKNCFKSCSKLATLDLSDMPDGATITFGESCFYETGINNFVWPDASKNITITIGQNAFFKSKFTTLNFPSNVTITSIGTNAFDSSTLLTSLTINSITADTTGPYAFKGCTQLGSVSFGSGNNTITKISKACFNGCSALNSFDFDGLSALNRIAESAFAGAGKLKSDGKLTLPANVTVFEASAFQACKLVEVVFPGGSVDFGANAFYNISTLTSVRFTNKDCTWSSYNNSVFASNSNLTELQLPNKFNLNTSGATSMVLSDSNLYNGKIYLYHTFAEQTPSGGWRQYNSSGGLIDPSYYVKTLSDLSYATAGGNTTFWTPDAYGKAIPLGTLTAKTATLATFSSGYTLDDNGIFTAP